MRNFLENDSKHRTAGDMCRTLARLAKKWDDEEHPQSTAF